VSGRVLNTTSDGMDLVTGGAGFIGSHVVELLLAAGRRVRVVDNFATGREDNLPADAAPERLQLIIGDIADPAVCDAAVEGCTRVFHLAALADIVPSIQRPEAYFRANVDGTFAICEAARRAGVSRLIYVASSTCYGLPDAFPTPENAPLRPQYPYALTKMLGEQIVLNWAQVYGLHVASVRLFNVYGPRARTSGSYGAVFGVFLAQLLAGEPLTIVGDGGQTRDFTFVTDVAQALLAAAERAPSGSIYNVGSGRDVSVNRLVELLGAERTVHLPKRPGEPDRTFADITRIRAELGWEPQVPIEAGVEIMLQHINHWRDAPVWTPARIQEATRDWFHYLGREAAG
jgi:UDP-glucose 4-epimerase